MHKNMSIERQASEVREVKHSESGLILDPVALHDSATLRDAHKLMTENKIGGIPTDRDLHFETEMNKCLSDIMTNDKIITAPKGTDLKQAELILLQYKIEKLPII